MEVSSVVRDCLHPHIITIALVQVIMDLIHRLPHLIIIPKVITTAHLRILHRHTNKSCGSITSSSNIIIINSRVPQDLVRSVYQVRNIRMTPCRITPESMLITTTTGREGTDTILLTITTIPNMTNVHEGIMG